MVFITDILCQVARRIKHRSNFMDNIRVYVRGGSGGQGLSKFGGYGGEGGSVYVVADNDATLMKLLRDCPKKRFVAETGENSKRYALLGKPGTDVEIFVPPGVCAKTDDDTILGEVNQPGDRVLVARGGMGGRPETGFRGEKGQALSVRLDLKLIADVGLVGFPNAGKSTLLSAVSRAAPKIASYPFTTLKPQVGVIKYEDLRQISMADLPGLIEGAHNNVGMGHRFLKHVERTKILLFVVDVTGFQLNPTHACRSAFETIVLLNKELELYRSDLVTKPAVLALNKTDIDGTHPLVEEVMEKVKRMKECAKEMEPAFIPKQFVKFDNIIPISAKEGDSIEFLKDRLRILLDVYADINEDRGKLWDKTNSAIAKDLTEHLDGRLV